MHDEEAARHGLDVATRVLIVDDHASFRGSARTLLRSEGYDVVGEAETGTEAVRLAEELKPDLVLLDVQLPDLDGFEVTALLLELDEPPEVVLTSSRDDYAAAVVGTGALGFVAKDALSGKTLDALLG
jgi:DNA-binding NarL/FixJ family response regulator